MIATASLALVPVAIFGGPDSAQASRHKSCDLYASSGGSDTAPGTWARPFRTVQRLVDSLRAGESGCLRAGIYRGDVTFRRGGTRRAAVTLRSSPRQRARIVGRLSVARGADHVRISNLDLDGRNRARLPSPTVNAAHVRFEGNDVTNRNTAICFVLGSVEYGRAVGTLLKGNRIHDCGALPATNHDHGVYVAHSRGVSITDNLIYDNADRGIQLYPDAHRTLIRNNVIDGNGEGVIFSGDDGLVSSDNRLEGNLITNSRVRHNVESNYPEGHPVGRNNLVRSNCIHGGARDFGPPWPGGIGTQIGFRAIDNLTVDPQFVSRSRADFRLLLSSPCRALVLPRRWPLTRPRH